MTAISTGAAMPACWCVGSAPMRIVGTEMHRMLSSSVGRLPRVSPRWPNSIEPSGLAANPIAHTPQYPRDAVIASVAGKNCWVMVADRLLNMVKSYLHHRQRAEADGADVDLPCLHLICCCAQQPRDTHHSMSVPVHSATTRRRNCTRVTSAP